MQQPKQVILYEDQVVLITQQSITIKNYYSPIPVDKQIHFGQISDVFLVTKSSKDSFIDFSSLNPFGSSSNKPPAQKMSLIEMWLKNSKSKVEVTPLNVEKVFKLIKTKVQHEEFKENVNLGLDKMKNSVNENCSNLLGKFSKVVQNTSNKISAKGQQWSQEIKIQSAKMSQHF